MARTAEDDQKLAAQLGHFKQLRKVAGMLSFLAGGIAIRVAGCMVIGVPPACR